MSAITQLVAASRYPTSSVGVDWCTRISATPGHSRRDEVLWDVDERARRSSSQTRSGGRGPDQLAVAGLDELLEGLSARRIDHEPIEMYSNGARHVNIPDPDGNRSRSCSRPTPRPRRPGGRLIPNQRRSRPFAPALCGLIELERRLSHARTLRQSLP